MTIQEILDSFEQEIPELFKNVLGGLEPEADLIRKQVPPRLLRFDEGETAMVGVISDLRKDRDDEVVLPEGMDDSNYSGIVLWQHHYGREAIPHARSLYREVLPKRTPYQIIAKTQYLVELSDLAGDVYEYRKAGHPMGQSIGFRSRERLTKGQTGYDDLYKEWLKRVKAMLKDLDIKPTSDEFDEPRAFITKWELWEYSDVFIGSNVDALQLAVSKRIITPEEAKALVSFEIEDHGEKPFRNEHACRIEDPDQFDKFRRVNCDQKHDEKCIDVIFGIKGGKSKIQALRYPVKIWTEAAAKAHCKTREGSFEAAEKSADMLLLEEKLAALESPLDTATLEEMWDTSTDLKQMWDNATDKLSG